jgi:hypothetical protein
MPRSGINTGFPNPNYVTELGNRDAILPGAYEIAQAALSAVSSQSIGNLTLAATGAAIDSAALTLAATGTGTVTASLSATIADLTLAATATVTGSASLAATIDPITLAATAAVIVSASVEATIADLTLNATAAGAAARPRDGVYPLWWWPAYVKRHEAEREAVRQKWLLENTVEATAISSCRRRSRAAKRFTIRTSRTWPHSPPPRFGYWQRDFWRRSQ